jgi:predicted TIM-barrel fold metal-dependent hydrolase
MVQRNICLWLTGTLIFLIMGCAEKNIEFYTVEDFVKVPKIDAHFHYNTSDVRFMEYADSINFRFVSPNVDAGMSIDRQFGISGAIRQKFPDKFFFLGTFSVDNFNEPWFSEYVIERIEESMKAGASGIKLWKNIGMDLQGPAGEFIMIDNPVFEPVFRYLELHNIPVLGHLGEPLNCWLPLEEMTLGNDRRYFADNPRYHMFLHPTAPSYEDQIKARDNVLEQHSGLVFAGAHLASLEWSIDELGRWFDSFPNLKVDLSARMGHLQYQSLNDHEGVRNFLIRYQDRIMYGSDTAVSDLDSDYKGKMEQLHQVWLEDWIYMATDSTLIVDDLDRQHVRGLKLPRTVVDKIFSKNAEEFFITRSSY